MAYNAKARVNKIAQYVGVQSPQHMPSGSIAVDNIMRIIHEPLVVVVIC